MVAPKSTGSRTVPLVACSILVITALAGPGSSLGLPESSGGAPCLYYPPPTPNQPYPAWTLCIAPDGSNVPNIPVPAAPNVYTLPNPCGKVGSFASAVLLTESTYTTLTIPAGQLALAPNGVTIGSLSVSGGLVGLKDITVTGTTTLTNAGLIATVDGAGSSPPTSLGYSYGTVSAGNIDLRGTSTLHGTLEAGAGTDPRANGARSGPTYFTGVRGVNGGSISIHSPSIPYTGFSGACFKVGNGSRGAVPCVTQPLIAMEQGEYVQDSDDHDVTLESGNGGDGGDFILVQDAATIPTTAWPDTMTGTSIYLGSGGNGADALFNIAGYGGYLASGGDGGLSSWIKTPSWTPTLGQELANVATNPTGGSGGNAAVHVNQGLNVNPPECALNNVPAIQIGHSPSSGPTGTPYDTAIARAMYYANWTRNALQPILGCPPGSTSPSPVAGCSGAAGINSQCQQADASTFPSNHADNGANQPAQSPTTMDSAPPLEKDYADGTVHYQYKDARHATDFGPLAQDGKNGQTPRLAQAPGGRGGDGFMTGGKGGNSQVTNCDGQAGGSGGNGINGGNAQVYGEKQTLHQCEVEIYDIDLHGQVVVPARDIAISGVGQTFDQHLNVTLTRKLHEFNVTNHRDPTAPEAHKIALEAYNETVQVYGEDDIMIHQEGHSPPEVDATAMTGHARERVRSCTPNVAYYAIGGNGGPSGAGGKGGDGGRATAKGGRGGDGGVRGGNGGDAVADAGNGANGGNSGVNGIGGTGCSPGLDGAAANAGAQGFAGTATATWGSGGSSVLTPGTAYSTLLGTGTASAGSHGTTAPDPTPNHDGRAGTQYVATHPDLSNCSDAFSYYIHLHHTTWD